MSIVKNDLKKSKTSCNKLLRIVKYYEDMIPLHTDMFMANDSI